MLWRDVTCPIRERLFASASLHYGPDSQSINYTVFFGKGQEKS